MPITKPTHRKPPNLSNTPAAKPFLKWAGGKAKLAEAILAQVPEEFFYNEKITYVEPFVGGGAVLFTMLRYFRNTIERAVVYDLNPDLVNAYTVVRDQPDYLNAATLSLSRKYFRYADQEGRKEVFLQTREDYNSKMLGPVERAAHLIFLNRTCFNGLYRVNKSGKFNVPFGKYANPTIHRPELIHDLSCLLRKVIIREGDFSKSFDYASDSSLYYFDPPYKPLSASSSFTAYSSEGFDDHDQIRLKHFCDSLTQKGSHFILSNSDPKNTDNQNDFFDELYTRYTIRRVSAARSINSKSSGRGKIKELLISNGEQLAEQKPLVYMDNA